MQLIAVDKGSSIQVSEAVFGRDYSPALIHQILTAYSAKARAGTKAQKNRSDVSGGGKKPHAQKGSGRARAGSSRSPLWRKGGVTFAARNRDFSQKVNRKMYRAGLKSILSQLVREDRLKVVGSFAMSAPKTKDFLAMMAKWNVTNAEPVVLVVKDWEENFCLSARNIPNLNFCDVDGLDLLTLVKCKNVLIEESAVKHLEEVLA